jgi:hypothetical protein
VEETFRIGLKSTCKNKMFDDVGTWHVGQMKIFRGNSCGSGYDIIED